MLWHTGCQVTALPIIVQKSVVVLHFQGDFLQSLFLYFLPKFDFPGEIAFHSPWVLSERIFLWNFSVVELGADHSRKLDFHFVFFFTKEIFI